MAYLGLFVFTVGGIVVSSMLHRLGPFLLIWFAVVVALGVLDRNFQKKRARN